jgi:DNA invertase Pin-like site-specific DNA recombinase
VNIAIYTRVSTDKQDPQMQDRELREYCQRRDWTIVGTYTDSGVSGTKESRPELNRMMADAKRRKFDAVLCWKFDRIGRSLRHLVNLLAELESLGIAFVSYSDSVDLTTPQGKLMFQIICAMAEFERSLTVERVKAGLKNAKANGKRLGRPSLGLDASDARVLRNSGHSLREIGTRLRCSEGSVRRLLATA